jgi:plastocyanin
VTDATITARDNIFEPAAIRVPAGEEVTLTLENAGESLHDWQVLNVSDISGGPIKTDLLAAGQTATIQFTIASPGEFTFYCEVHPVEMRGQLTVQ